MTDTVRQADNTAQGSAPVWHEIDPWGAAPHIASRLLGLGGNEPSPDPAYMFATAFFSVAAGPFQMRIIAEGYRRSDEVFLLEISNRSEVTGSPSVRMRLDLAPLNAIADTGGYFDVHITGEPGIQYALSGFTDRDLQLTALRIFVDRPFNLAIGSEPYPDAGSARVDEITYAKTQTRDVSRLIGSEKPSFTNSYSQPSTHMQTLEPSFLARCVDLGLKTDDPNAWPEAFVLHALMKYGALAPDRHGIGFDCSEQALPWCLQSRCADILLTRFDVPGAEANLGVEMASLKKKIPDLPSHCKGAFTTLVPKSLPTGYFRTFDFGWWIAPRDISEQEIAGQLGAIASALKSGGVAVLVLPFHPRSDIPQTHGKAESTMTRSMIERLALEVIAQGHSVAQLRFGRARDTPDDGQFGMIIARS